MNAKKQKEFKLKINFIQLNYVCIAIDSRFIDLISVSDDRSLSSRKTEKS